MTQVHDKTRDSRLGAITASGITPLLDTVFLLLFFFLAVSEIPTTRDVELVHLTLPLVEPEAEAAADAEERLVIQVDADSRVRLQRRAGDGASPQVITSRGELDVQLESGLDGAEPADTGVEIRADRDAKHGVAVELLQHLRRRGFRDVQLVASGEAKSDDPFSGEGS